MSLFKQPLLNDGHRVDRGLAFTAFAKAVREYDWGAR
jgi:hypothetical protein